MFRARKNELVARLRDRLTEASFLAITRQSGLNVAEQNNLRRSVRETGARFIVVKNRLMRLALADSPFSEVDLSGYFSGPSAITLSNDPVSASKTLVKFAKGSDGRLELVGSVMLPGQVLSPARMEELATLPGEDELRGRLIGLIEAPATKLVRLLSEPGAQIARLVSAKAEQ